MEDKNMARMQISEEEIEQVVGGCFQFFKGGTACLCQGHKFRCEANAQFQIINLINANQDKTELEIMEMAVQQGILRPV